MPVPRFRLRSLMILVLVSGLAMGGWLQLSKLDAGDFEDLKQRAFPLLPFSIFVLAKFGLMIATQSKRRAPEAEAKPRPADEFGPEEVPS